MTVCKDVHSFDRSESIDDGQYTLLLARCCRHSTNFLRCADLILCFFVSHLVDTRLIHLQVLKQIMLVRCSPSYRAEHARLIRNKFVVLTCTWIKSSFHCLLMRYGGVVVSSLRTTRIMGWLWFVGSIQ